MCTTVCTIQKGILQQCAQCKIMQRSTVCTIYIVLCCVQQSVKVTKRCITVCTVHCNFKQSGRCTWFDAMYKSLYSALKYMTVLTMYNIPQSIKCLQCTSPCRAWSPLPESVATGQLNNSLGQSGRRDNMALTKYRWFVCFQ